MDEFFRVVVSSENTHYMAWQTQLFCFSSVTYLKKSPLVVVHSTDSPLRPEYLDLRNRGVDVIEAPSHARLPNGWRYLPRNTIGSLLAAGHVVEDEYILLCDPDMVFTGQLAYPRTFAAEFYDYIKYSDPVATQLLQKTCLTASINDLDKEYRIGVPYLIYTRDCMRVARRWQAVMDLYEAPKWVELMYAYGIALKLENIGMTTTHIMVSNYNQGQVCERPLIHYCYGDSTWNKRMFIKEGHSPVQQQWNLGAIPKGTVLYELLRQVQEAQAFFRVV